MLIRKAKPTDAQLIAWTVLTALDMETDDMPKFVACCADPVSMYSWTNSYIAEIDGVPAGCLIAYDGSRYDGLRAYTWPTLWDNVSPESIVQTVAESQAGEFYLDSMAILPEHRGAGIGAELIKTAVNDAKASTAARCTLLVDVNKPRLKAYYESLGFREACITTFLDHEFYKMSLPL